MDSEKALINLSNDLQSNTSAGKTEYQAPDGHISQIPGLSPKIISPPVERARGKRSTVQNSDSEYVKLAKQGGHKGLLWHESEVTSKLNNDPHTITPSQEVNNPGSIKPPFWTDSLSTWERENDFSSKKQVENMNDQHKKMDEVQTSSQFEPSKYKKRVFDKKPEPVDMSKLLSFGYQEDKKPVQ